MGFIATAIIRAGLALVAAGWLTLAAPADLKTIPLPPPDTSGGKPLMEALRLRRTVRDLRPEPLAPRVLSNLLWAAFGINRPDSAGRTAPSAWNQQEVDIYILTPEAAYLYRPRPHELEPVVAGDWRALTGTDSFLREAPVVLVYIADFARAPKTAEADRRYYAAAHAGFIGENVYLYCASAGLGTVFADSADRTALANKLGLRAEQQITFVQAVGYPR